MIKFYLFALIFFERLLYSAILSYIVLLNIFLKVVCNYWPLKEIFKCILLYWITPLWNHAFDIFFTSLSFYMYAIHLSYYKLFIEKYFFLNCSMLLNNLLMKKNYFFINKCIGVFSKKEYTHHRIKNEIVLKPLIL